MLLANKVCLVTGAAGGIGKAIARECAMAGASVAIADLQAERIERARDELATASLPTTAFSGDLAAEGTAAELCRGVLASFGRIDVLINAHGLNHVADTTVTEVPEDVFDLTLAVNLKSVFLMCRAAIPHMRERGGSIVNIASIGAIIGSAGIAYTASKAALVAISRQIAYQEAANGIRSNSILPGPVDTEMVRTTKAKQGMRAAPTVPGAIQRMGTPEEVAHLATFLASDRSSFITAASYVVDGGLTQY